MPPWLMTQESLPFLPLRTATADYVRTPHCCGRDAGTKVIRPNKAKLWITPAKRPVVGQDGYMPRFLTLADVAEQLQINSPAAYALVRSGELKAIQVGGRGQWRVEEKMLEQYIEERYAEASRIIQESKSKSV